MIIHLLQILFVSSVEEPAGHLFGDLEFQREVPNAYLVNMYAFPYFKDKDPQSVIDFMQAHPFVTLIGSFLDGQPAATQVPVLLADRDRELYIQGHIMRKTDHHKAFDENPQALVLFTGPSAYVSASWYSEPKQGSTWNYMTVQASGILRWMDAAEMTDFMQRFTLHFEGGNAESPTVFNNLSDAYTQAHLPGIVGFEVKIGKLEHTFKLSQNRDEQSYQNIIKELEKRGGTNAEVAEAMKKRRKSQ